VHGSVEEDEMTVRLPLDEPTTAAPEVPLDTIEVALTRGFALEIAPPWIVERGIAYVEEGRVHDVQAEPTQVHALVDGSEPYEVHLSREDDDILADCTCPMGGAADQPRKHLVAVALAIAERAEHDDRLARRLRLKASRARERDRAAWGAEPPELRWFVGPGLGCP
jgi:uncharacterized Zn finger protein